MKIYLIRHGQDDETVRGGWSQSGLSSEGIQQVKELTNKIQILNQTEKFSRIFSSDLPRALETAQPIAKNLNFEIDILPEFREFNNGLLAGMPNEEADRDYPNFRWAQLDWDEPYPQGESPCGFYYRIRKAWHNLLLDLHCSESVILVTHAAVMRIVSAIVSGENYTNKVEQMNFPYADFIVIELGGSSDD